MKINIGLKEADCKKIADSLSRLLANTYTLYLKTQNYHWNLTGFSFYSYHLMFESQYKELSDAIDLIAERIRALGHHTPASFEQFLKLTSIKEEQGHRSIEEMVKQLLQDHESMIGYLREICEEASEFEDEATANLLADRLEAHEKTAWMLRSSV